MCLMFLCLAVTTNAFVLLWYFASIRSEMKRFILNTLILFFVDQTDELCRQADGVLFFFSFCAYFISFHCQFSLLFEWFFDFFQIYQFNIMMKLCSFLTFIPFYLSLLYFIKREYRKSRFKLTFKIQSLHHYEMGTVNQK